LDAACVDGLQPVTGDAAFTRTFPLGELRARAREQRLELGFDPGPERFATFLTLRLCHTVLDRLPNVVAAARRFATQSIAGRYNFYLEPNTFPYDADTTSVTSAGAFEAGVTTSEALLRSAHELTLASYTSENVTAVRYLPIPRNQGVTMVYWLDCGELPAFFRRPQFDAAVASNVMYAALLAGEHDFDTAAFEPTWHYVQNHLTSGDYLKGTFYYPSPDSFLCLFALLCARFPKRMTQTAALALQAAIDQRGLATTTDPVLDPKTPLNSAQRIIAADALNQAAGMDLVTGIATMKEKLATLQGPDGLWDVGPLYGYGPAPFFIGSRELTATYAIAALGRAWSNVKEF
jgi:hypothetical protein